MALVPFPSSPTPPDEDPSEIVTFGRSRWREDVVPGASRRAPDTTDSFGGCDWRLLRHLLHFPRPGLRIRHAPHAEHAPGGRESRADGAGRVLHALFEGRRAGGAPHRDPLRDWQLWLFIAPGLYANEKRFAIPFVLFGTVFFATGAAFSHYVAFPWTWKFFVNFKPEYVQ